MFQLLCYLTGAVLISGALIAYYRSHDALHPAVILAPTFLFMYAAWPLLIDRDGALEQMFREGVLVHAATLFLVSITLLYSGLLHGASPVGRSGTTSFDARLSGAASQRLYTLALIVGGLSVVAYAYMLANSGGLLRAFGHAKGGVEAPSGYIGEATLLTFPALLIMALALRQRAIVRPQDVVVVLLIASPQLLQAFLGGRRGPMFLTLSVMFFVWHLARRTRPNIRQAIIAIGLIGFITIAVESQRSNVYLGSEQGFSFSQLTDRLAPRRPEVGDTYVTAVATVAAVDALQDFYWGYRYFVTFFIRPIPKQIWPTKYEDMHADWLTDYGTRSEEGRYSGGGRFRAAQRGLAGIDRGHLLRVLLGRSGGLLLARAGLRFGLAPAPDPRRVLERPVLPDAGAEHLPADPELLGMVRTSADHVGDQSAVLALLHHPPPIPDCAGAACLKRTDGRWRSP